MGASKSAGEGSGVGTLALLVLPVLALSSAVCFVYTPKHLSVSIFLDQGLFQGKLGYGKNFMQPATDFPPTLQYFDSRGRAEVVRVALNDNGVGFNDVTFTSDEWGKTSPNGLKAQLTDAGKLAFGQVPLLTVPQAWGAPDLHIVQSNAILRYLGRNLGFYQGSPTELAKVDLAIDGVEDVRSGLMGIKYGPGTDEEKDAKYAGYFADESRAPKWLGFYETMVLSSATGFVAGTKSVSVADYLLLALIDTHETVQPQRTAAILAARFPALTAFAAKMRARPGIAAYLSSAGRLPQ